MRQHLENNKQVKKQNTSKPTPWIALGVNCGTKGQKQILPVAYFIKKSGLNHFLHCKVVLGRLHCSKSNCKEIWTENIHGFFLVNDLNSAFGLPWLLSTWLKQEYSNSKLLSVTKLEAFSSVSSEMYAFHKFT